MRIELEEIFKQGLKNGSNLFVGAGFSQDSTNLDGEQLPIGNKLAISLSDKFKTPKLDLTKVTAIIESKVRMNLMNI